MKKLRDNILATLIGCIIAFVLGEIVLKIFNPFPSRVRGNKIQLKSNLMRKIIIEPRVDGLDKEITYSSNKIGFRGENPPDNIKDLYSIFTVGGSTTECSRLDDSKTWSELLYDKLKKDKPKIWLNNAGLDGCSTYGHNILLDDYLVKFKPNMIVFLVGVNDRGKATFETEDGFLINRRESWVNKLIKKSEIANLINNMIEANKARKVNIGHGTNITKTSDDTLTVAKQNEKINFHKKHLSLYKKRVEILVNKCTKNNIAPVLVTQPLLDDTASLGWEIMEMYNQVTKNVATENNILSIDLANKLEKKEEYYYDNMHYTNSGASRVADIIYEGLKDSIKR